MADVNEHTWFRARFAASVAGLLDADEEARFRNHADSCDRCGNALKVYSEGMTSGQRPSEHIPPSILARWDQARQTLRGLERKMVRRHLERCAECRSDLEFMGFEPLLGLDPDLELCGEPVPDRGGRGEVDKPDSRVDPSTWLRWFFGGWAVAATAALVLFLVIGRGEAPPTPDSAVIPWVVPQLTRGGETVVLQVHPHTRSMAVAVRIPSGLPPETQATVEVFSPEGKRLARQNVGAVDLGRGTVMVLLNSREIFEVGTYRVLFWRGEPGISTGAPEESRFEIRLEETPDTQ